MKAGAWLALLAVSLRLVAAAPFQNLGFDEAQTNRVIPDGGPLLRGIGPTEDLLPGWQFTKGGAPQSTLGLNLSSLALGAATLISADQSDYYRFPVEGSYALFLVGTPGNREPFALGQRGDVPLGMQWLTYSYQGYPMLVSINGNTLLPAFQTSDSQTFNISTFGGQGIDLLLTTTGPLMPTQAGSTYLDSIIFAIPEPSAIKLLACSVGIIVILRFLTPLRRALDRPSS